MADETLSDDGRDDSGQRTQPEGVRIIGAQEAADLVGRSEPAEGDEGVVETTATERDEPGEAPAADAAEPVEVAIPAVEPDQSFELPHYAEPPTGQVPKVVIGEETDSRWSGLSDQPRWRDTDQHFEEHVGFDDLVDDAPRLGALDETGEHRTFFADLDLTDDGVPTLADLADDAGSGAGAGDDGRGGRSDDVEDRPASTPTPGADDDAPAERRPPAPRRRRPAGERPTRTAAIGADSGNGGRNLPMAVAVGVGLLIIGGGAFSLGATATMVLVTIVLGLCAAELFTTLNQSGYRPAGLLGIVAVAGLSIAPLYQQSFAYPVVLGLTALSGLTWFLFVQPGEGAVMNLGVTLLGVAYVGGLGSFATLLLGDGEAVRTGKLTNQGIGVLVAAVLITVSYDVGAYFIGKSFGSTALTTVSPNKTQEGLFGGVAVAIVLPTLILWLSKWDPVGVDLKTTIGFCLICALMAPVGDLCESAIKRDLGVKDMGTLLPGHGGVLDRFDAMLFVLPTAYFMAHLLELGKPVAF